MEGVLVLLAIAVVGAVLVGPGLAIVALVRSGAAHAELRRLRRDLAALEARVGALVKTVTAARAAGAAVPEAEAAPASPARPVEPQRPAVAPAEPPVPVAQAVRAPQPAAVSTPIRPPVSPPPPIRPAAPPPPSRPTGPSFDWENLLGLRGAAWLGGIALVIAAALLAKWAFDEDLITPAMRVAILIALGTGALLGAELSLRKGYATTANAVSGAGIAILYIAFYAGRAVYGLFAPELTFALMALVTVVACAVAIRYDAIFTAVLGLLGGFATPILVSTGVDRPISLFSYILLLNVGLLAIALRRKWHSLVLLALGGTFVIEMAWYLRYMSPEKTIIGLAAFLVLGLVFAFLPIVGRSHDETVMNAGALGGVLPYLFALLLAGRSTYAGEWPLLFSFIGLLSAALVVVGVLRARVELLVSAALAAALFLPIWAGQNLRESAALWGPTLAAIAIVAVFNLARPLALRLRPDLAEERPGIVGLAGAVAAIGLGLFALVLVTRGLGDPPWAFLTLAVALGAVLVVCSGEGRLPGLLAGGTLALALLIQIWFFTTTHGPDLLRNLALPLMLPIVLSLLASRRAATRRAGLTATEDEIAVLVAGGTALAGLFGCLLTKDLGREPVPLFAALAVVTGLIVVAALRSGWDLVVPVALAASALFATSWQLAHFQATDLATALVAYVAFSLAFLALPFIVPAPAQSRRGGAPGLWFSSALAGPLLFYALYHAVTKAWGKAAIGALPLVFAAFAVLALSGVARRFVARPQDEGSARLRLRYLALFAAVALGFVALAIPLQLDRQWITVGWALEGLAVFWLFGRLPHPGLRLFGAVLFGAVGARLLLNPEVVRYEPRGLPIVNWLLYTYGVPALACFLGALALRQAEVRSPGASGEKSAWRHLAPAVVFLGLLIVFWLINLEIAHFFSSGDFVEVSFERHYARDLAASVAWGLYAITLLIIGVWRGVRALRYVGLGFLLLTVGKVFLYDLATLTGLYRVLSFFGLAIVLVLVSLIYQRFVVSREGSR